MERPNKKNCYQHDPFDEGLGISTYSKKQDKFIDQLLAERKELLIKFGNYWGIDHEGSNGDTEDMVNEFLKSEQEKSNKLKQ